MTRLMISLFVLAFAVAGLAMTARAQQDPPPDAAASQDNAQSNEAPSPDISAAPQPVLPSPEASPVSTCKPDTILVKVNDGVDPAAVIARHGGTLVRTIGGIDVQVIAVPAGTGRQAIDEYMADPDVKYAEADQIVRAASTGSGGNACS
jgi:hypothetical protein